MAAKVVMATSMDERLNCANVLTSYASHSNLGEFWLTTGLYPQELLILFTPARDVRTVHFVTTNVRKVQVEGSETNSLTTFAKLGETEIGSNKGGLQRESVPLTSTRPLTYLKFILVAGYEDFASVHSIKFD